MKKLNIAVLTVLLVFQTLLSPLATYASATDATIPSESIGDSSDVTNEPSGDELVGGPESDGTTEDAGDAFSQGIVPVNGVQTTTPNTAAIDFSLSNMKILQGEDVNHAPPIGSDPIVWSSSNKFHVSVEWAVAATGNLKDGDEVSFQLPSQFETGVVSGKTIDDGNGGSYGTYTVSDTNLVTFKFNSNAVQDAKSGLNGAFVLQRNMDKSKFEANKTEELEISYDGKLQDKVSVTFTPSDTKAMKNGVAYRDGIQASQNANKILWTVDINKAGETLTNAILKDTPDNGLVIDTSSVKMALLTLDLDGNVLSVGTEITVAPSKVTSNGTAFDIELGEIKQAYRITYETTIDRAVITGTAPTVKNKIQLFDGTTPKTEEIPSNNISLKYAESLTKKSNKDYNSSTQEMTWTIDYNMDQVVRTGDIVDTIIGPHSYVNGSLEVYELTVNPDLTTSQGTTNLVAVFNKNETPKILTITPPADGKAYRFIYKTKLDHRIISTKGEKVSNSVTAAGITKTTDPYSLSQDVFHKSGSSDVDYNGKFLTWTLTVNQDEKMMNNVVVEDNFEQGVGLTLYGDGFVDLPTNAEVYFKKDGKYSAKPIVKTASESTTEGFKIVFPANITTKQVIKYKTKFAPENIPNDKKYNNTGKIIWNEPTLNDTEHSFTRDADITVDDYSKTNGNKKVTYDRSTKQFTWVVDVNYNLYDLTNAVLTDTFNAGQALVKDSFKVNKLTLNNSNNGVVLGDPVTVGAPTILSSTSFELNLGTLNKEAYRIEYKTTLVDEKVTGTYSNHAILNATKDGSTQKVFEKDATHKPDKSDEIVNKSGKQGANYSDLADWTVMLNESRSKLSATGDLLLSDALQGAQKLLPDTFKLQEQYYVANDTKAHYRDLTLNKVMEKQYTFSNGGTVVATINVIDDKEFTLQFNQEIENQFKLTYQAFIEEDHMGFIGNNATFAGHSKIMNTDANKGAIQIKWVDSAATAVNRGKLTIKKVDAANNSTILPGAIFNLYNSDGSILLEEGLEVGVDGTVQTQFNYVYKTFKLEEVKAPSGYVKPTNKFDVTFDPTSGIGVIKNTKLPSNFGCTTFDLTINGLPSDYADAKKVEIKKDGTGSAIHLGTLDADGKVSYTGAPLSVGNYIVYVDGEIMANTITVDGNCEDTIQFIKGCPLFTFTIHNVDTALNGKKVEVVNVNDSTNTMILLGNLTVTNTTGTITAAALPQGTFKVYVNNKLMTKMIEVDSTCAATINFITGCPQFTLTINNLPTELAGKNVEIEKDGTTTKIHLGNLVDNKVVSPQPLESGKYKVYVDGQVMAETIHVDEDCEDVITFIKGCPVFTLSIKDLTTDDIGKEVKLVSENGIDVIVGNIKSIGVETFTLNTVPGGKYKVFIGTDELFGTVNIDGDLNCQGTVNKVKACPQFTLTVNQYGKNAPVDAGVKVVIKTATNEVVTEGITDTNGQIIFKDKTKLVEGTKYTVYNSANIELGKITVTYKENNCLADVQVTENACPIFTITIKDVNGNSRSGVSISIKDKTGIIEIGTGITDAQGQITVPYLLENVVEYQVYEGVNLLTTITVKDCKATYQPVPTPPVSPPLTGDPSEPTDPSTPPTNPGEPTDPSTPPTNPGEPTDPSTPPTNPSEPTDPSTPPTNPTNPGTTTPPTLPGLDEVIKPIPPSILPTPKDPFTPGDLAEIIEEYSKDPSKLDDLLNELKDLLNYYNTLSPKQKAEFERIYDVDSLKMLLDELKNVAGLQTKLPQTDGASQYGMMLAGTALLLTGAWLIVTRRRKA